MYMLRAQREKTIWSNWIYVPKGGTIKEMCKVHLSNGQMAVRLAKGLQSAHILRAATSSFPIAHCPWPMALALAVRSQWITMNCAGAWQRRSSSVAGVASVRSLPARTGSHNGLFIQIILAMSCAKQPKQLPTMLIYCLELMICFLFCSHLRSLSLSLLLYLTVSFFLGLHRLISALLARPKHILSQYKSVPE